MICAALFFLGLFPSNNVDEAWIEVLRDAQLANQALVLKHGHALMHASYEPGQGRSTITIEADITWSDGKGFQKYRVSDAQAFISPVASDKPLEERPWGYLVRNEDHFITFTSESINYLRIHKKTNAPLGHLNFHPGTIWFTCCPPFSGGKPLPEMVGPVPPVATDGIAGENRFLVLPDKNVKQIRKDPDGGVAETIFSPAQAGNPISFQYTPTDPKLAASSISWQWKKVGKAFVLGSLDYIYYVVGKPKTVDWAYHLKVDKVDFQPVPESLFTSEHLIGLVPPDTIIQDDTTGRTAKANQSPGLSEKDLERAQETLKDGGFLKP